MCAGNKIFNNSDTTGVIDITIATTQTKYRPTLFYTQPYVGSSPYDLGSDMSGEKGAARCQQLCCSISGCFRWTFTDPQPGVSNHLCWLKGGYGVLT